MRVANSQLKAFVLDAGVVKKEDLDKAFAEAEKKETYLGALLVEKKLISEDDLKKLEAYILGIPFVNLEKEAIPPDVLMIIPELIAKKHNIVAFKKTGNDLQVAMLDPDDIQTIEFIKKKAGLRILPRLTNRAGIKEVVKQYQKSLQAEFGEIIKPDLADELTVIREEGENGGRGGEEDLKKMAEDLPIIKIVDTLIRHSIIEGSSDVHIEPEEREVVVRYRIDGILKQAMVLPKNVAAGVVARIKVMSNLQLDEHRLPQDGRFKIETSEYKISFRVSIMPVFDGEKIVMRLLPEKSRGLSLEALGFSSLDLEKLHRNIKKTVGMILATGPTGSGKTTTLYTVLDILNKPGVNIVTVEDPIEYRMQGVNQTQVRSAIGFTFASGLRSILRQDPDVIMVGEIRDTETASLAVNAALTGHLVLSTLHTNSASGALPRLLDMKVEPFLIASTVNIIIGQRLVRTLSSEKEFYTLGPAEKEALSKIVDLGRMEKILKREKVIGPSDTIENAKWARAKPGQESKDGFRGRLGIREVLEMSDGIRDLIMKNSTASDLERLAKEEGMTTMLEDGIVKAAQGLTTVEEVLRVISD
ncbi:MAG: hypothetical protein A3A28_03580 [Candidatus Sungbacteria bacterium RIFCSPLOWO2_01_FULL_47_32]|uniref:Bacterial type II secretion system protein E domain-containing protein n=1 Tax=Candidatus Sungbacteria bacterium RIFCSPHIGHO2_01_FULL_47_32 TaxID=1802264 RepID=A0A1G2KC55_9BACT|nr:MAG: type II secretion system protein E [Parcubacteria group bacterium GW2011_GWA2_47_10]OGZ95988.1 MAG: hypothetical protein A2633_01530 [Candidatus Sungbacteria bacterium RIFCSPHIGHO2_01_FULL_47_32]OGZ98117.1 MAG: hypothetical protein A3D57_00580 [Candidatus Sungbacteria bacterium RIFCSPHIGHO2_02_FULL_46_12]OHA06089.1 MAG: hypothetical protein A3A28_03580 [Candidatus Sungbacteria bacterium RIFCSPLOWO2_01_FULL_47_32]